MASGDDTTLRGEAERTLIVGLVHAGTRRDVVEEHLAELDRLIDTAGGVVVRSMTQERAAADPATVVGSGFVDRIADHCRDEDIRSVVFDEDLTGSQIRNLESKLPDDVKVLDRAAVILDIFAQRARSREAQTQVELAQLNYLLPRLTRRWTHLSRQAGGIGTRGVGETQLEIDRRLISKRIAALKRKLEVIERDRKVRRDRRQRQIASVALAGYTNAGKSSLFRRLTSADVLVEDRLFATLDPRARRVGLGDGVIAVLTDTVGFIRKLPHDLVAPFRSTLEETADADIVLHVVDVTHPTWEEHLRIGDEVLEGLGVESDRVLVVLNKIDLLGPQSVPHPPAGRRGWAVSAVTGAGIETLRSQLSRVLLSAPDVAFLRVPLDAPELVQTAVSLPYQIARRFGDDALEVAMRIDPQRLITLGLDGFRIPRWESTAQGGA
jgi:GTP-binding protein HflX